MRKVMDLKPFRIFGAAKNPGVLKALKVREKRKNKKATLQFVAFYLMTNREYCER